MTETLFELGKHDAAESVLRHRIDQGRAELDSDVVRNSQTNSSDQATRRLAETLHTLGFIKLKGHNFDEARVLLSEAFAMGEESALIAMAYLEKQANDPEAARVLYLQAMEFDDPDLNLEATFNLAVLEHEEENLERASELYVAASSRGHEQARFNLAVIRGAEGDTSGEREIYADLSNSESETVRRKALYSLGMIERRTQNLGTALESFQHAAKLGHFESAIAAAETERTIGNLEGAILMASKATELASSQAKRAESLNLFGDIELDANNIEAATEAYLTAVQLGDAHAFVGLGMIAARNDDIDEARSLYSRAIAELDLEEQIDAVYNLANLETREGNVQLAVDLYQSLGDRSSHALTNLGVIKLLSGDDDGARSLFERAHELGNVEASRNLLHVEGAAGNETRIREIVNELIKDRHMTADQVAELLRGSTEDT